MTLENSNPDLPRPPPPNQTVERVDNRTLRVRQRRVLLNTFVTLFIIAGLIVLLMANRDAVAIRGCRERMERVCEVLQARRAAGLPPTPSLPDPPPALDDPAHREAIAIIRTHAHYNVLYATQSITRLQTGVCACRWPHAHLFGETGRWVILYHGGTQAYEVQWMSEAEFQVRSGDLGLREIIGPASGH